MLIYLLKSGACLAVLFFFYKLFLEKENMHVFKRFYLLGALVLSLIIPAIVFTEYVEIPEPTTYTHVQHTTNEIIGVPPALEADVLDIEPLLWTAYFLGMLFFGIKFLKNLFQIFRRIRRNPKHRLNRFTQVLLQENFPPHTFLSYIFLNKKKLEANEIPKEVLLHEETHAEQKHSWDVVFVELLHVIFWVNPFVYLTKKAIKLNHEFLADQAVINKDVDQNTYQNTLLSFSSCDGYNTYQSSLPNAINYSSIKKRFTVMKKQTSKKSIVLRSLLLLPLLALLIFGFSQKETLEIYEETNHELVGDWIDEEQELDELSILQDGGDFVFNWIDSGSYKVQENNGEYFGISPKGKWKIPLLFNNESGTLVLGEKKFIALEESYKGKLYGSWINNERGVKFNVFHSGNEIVWEVIEGTTKAVRYYPKKLDDRYGFTYGAELLSFKVENGTLYDSKGVEYSRISNSDSKEQPKDIRIDIAESGRLLVEGSSVSLDFLSTELGKYNKSLSWEDRKSKVRAFIYLDDNAPSSVMEIVERILNDYGVALINIVGSENSATSMQDGASRKLMDEYTKLAKHYNEMDSNRMTIKKKDVERLKYIYNLMSDKQRVAAEPFPDFPEPPPVPDVPDAPNEREEAYNTLQKIIEEQDPYDNVHAGIYISAPPSSPDQKSAWTVTGVANRDSRQDANGTPIPPVAPTIALHANTKGYSKALKSALNEYLEQNNALETAVDLYQTKKKGTTDDLWNSYNKAIELYAAYYEIAQKEGKFVPPMQRNSIDNHPPAPPAPHVSKGKVSDIPPPPPPPDPMAPIDHVIEMAKKGATFYYEGKKISSDKAIQLLKKNKSLNIETKQHNSKNPQVKISKEPYIHGQSSTSTPSSKINVETGNIEINGESHFYSTKEGVTSYINSQGNQVDKNGKLLGQKNQKNPTFYYNGQQISSAKAHRLLSSNTNIQVVTEDHSDSEYAIVLSDLNNNNKYNQNLMNNPNSAIDLTEVISKGAVFFFNDKPITTEKALWLTQNDNMERVQVKEGKDKKPEVYFWNSK